MFCSGTGSSGSSLAVKAVSWTAQQGALPEAANAGGFDLSWEVISSKKFLQLEQIFFS